MQTAYAVNEQENDDLRAAKRAFYRTLVNTALARIARDPEDRIEMLRALLSYAHGAKMLDGLETIFLTLLAATDVARHRELFRQALKVWDRFASEPIILGGGPMGFYDVRSKDLVLFSRATSFSLRPGRANAHLLRHGDGLAEALTKLGAWTIKDPFRYEDLPGAQTPEIMQVRGKGGARHDKKDLRNRVAAWAAVAVGVGVILEFVPNPLAKGLGAGLLVGGIGVEVIIGLDEIYGPDANKPSSKPADAPDGGPGSSLDVPIPSTTPGDGTPEGTDGDGNQGISVSGGQGADGSDHGGWGEGEGGEGGEGGESGPCFSPETLVAMADGLAKPISEIRFGDRVLAADAKGEVQPRAVSRTYRHAVAARLDLHLSNGQTLRTTAAHRFWTQERGYLAAGLLQRGMALHSAAGAPITVAGKQDVPGDAEVFNLTVETDHTYFVGPEQILVHNRKIVGPLDT